jgi:SAM-dependent methyltransferase
MVYATDTEQPYAEYVGNIMAKNGYKNLKAIHTQSNSLGVDDQVDCILMSSLYHIIYTWSREDERKAVLTSIKEHLKPHGYIVIVDNLNRHGEELNNCHVDPRLVQAQLGYWGFKTVALKQLSEQRYMLTMQRDDSYVPTSKVKAKKGERVLNVKNQKSVVHIGSLDSYDITDRGVDAANYVYDFMGGGDRSLAEIAIKKYDEIIPAENFGGEYSALQWLCEAKIATEAERQQMLKDPLTNSFYHYLTDDSCRVLRYYLLHKYKLGNDSLRMLSDSLLEKTGEVGRTHRSYLEDYILALNPKRPSWENTPVILDNLGITEGKVIADIGSGSGFFTYKFSKMVGDGGKVLAVELKDEHIDRLKTFIGETGIRNIEVVKGKEDVLELPCQVDMMFMCSLYHIMYGVISDSDRDAYLKSLVKCLKPNGELIIVDNGPVDDDTLPYHGPYISRELIEDQLSFYGFELADYVQVIPQRYLLKFKLKK